MRKNHLFCFGLGYSSLNLARKLLAKGWRVSGTCRNEEKATELEAEGIKAYVFNEDIPLSDTSIFQDVTHILDSIPPLETGVPLSLKHHEEDLKNMFGLDSSLRWNDSRIKWVGYFSTTGVYGDHNGGWVNESTLVCPVEERSRLRVVSENAWLNSGLPVHIFRLAGIYGPGRNSLLRVKSGDAQIIEKKDHVFCRIHVDDIAQIVQASISNPQPGEIYNCADDLPAAQSEVISYCYELLGRTKPETISFEKAKLSPMSRSFYSSCRRVENNKIKNELGVKLKYPDYISGLRIEFKRL